MKITDFFIKHPVSAIILNAMIIIVGILSFYSLVVREYPDINLPKIMVETSFPNASPELIESQVTNVLEDELAGVEGVDYIESDSLFGKSIITLNFHIGTPVEKALVSIRDSISAAKASLPKDASDPIVTRSLKNSGPPFMGICVDSSSMGFSELTHYANIALKNHFRSVSGVSSVEVWGRPYTYKVTLDNKKMYNFGINANEVLAAIKTQAIALPVGKFRKESSITINNQIENAEDLENILLQNKLHPVFLKSIAKIELGSEDQKLRIKVNGKPGLCMGINRTSDANPLDVSKLIHQKLQIIKESLPNNLNMEIVLDQAAFINSSINNIKSSIFEAIIFVLIITFLFLRNIKATIIPIITIPISLIGSLLFLKIFGFSINIITLLAMVLAVGLVVDDAIVVLENITRHLEMGETPLKAAINGSKEIAFAVVAMTLTLTSVYAPIAFISGMTGQLFIEFAVALAGSVIISGVTAITLSPLMCSSLLNEKQNKLFPIIDSLLDKLRQAYEKTLLIVINYNKMMIIFLLFSMFVSVLIFKNLPHEVAPLEDRSLIGIFIPQVAGKTIDHTESNVQKIEDMVTNLPEKQGIITFVSDRGGKIIMPLKPIEQRNRSAQAIVNSLRPAMTSLPSMDAWPWSWDTALPGLDDASGNSELQLIVSTSDSYQKLLETLNNIRNLAEEKKLFRSVHHNLSLDNLSYEIKINKNILAKLYLTEQQVAKTAEIFFSGDTSTYFKKDNILYPITLEGNILPWGLSELYITNLKGERISMAAVADFFPKANQNSLFHYNQMRAAKLKTTIDGSLGESMNKLSSLVDEHLPATYQKNWTGIAKTHSDSAYSSIILFFLSLLFVYAILAVQFDSFIDPLIILFTVPLACLGALSAMYFSGLSLNIYSQVGIITLIGLITKHGILIVEFANQLHSQGNNLLDSIKKASSLRLRPIMMTTAAMVAGSVPLIISNSAGLEARYAIGIVLIAGLLLGTIFTLFVLPSLYYMVKMYRSSFTRL